jgi:hypothetical protein
VRWPRGEGRGEKGEGRRVSAVQSRTHLARNVKILHSSICYQEGRDLRPHSLSRGRRGRQPGGGEAGPRGSQWVVRFVGAPRDLPARPDRHPVRALRQPHRCGRERPGLDPGTLTGPEVSGPKHRRVCCITPANSGCRQPDPRNPAALQNRLRICRSYARQAAREPPAGARKPATGTGWPPPSIAGSPERKRRLEAHSSSRKQVCRAGHQLQPPQEPCQR